MFKDSLPLYERGLNMMKEKKSEKISLIIILFTLIYLIRNW